MTEREYSRVVHFTLVASVRASSKREADRLIDKATCGTQVGNSADISGSMEERLMGADLSEGPATIEVRGVQFSCEGSVQEPVISCSHDDLGKWLAWCSGHRDAQTRPFDRKELDAAKRKYESGEAKGAKQ